MSKRRQAGEWVWLAPYAGFTGESNRLKAEIQPETEADWCPCSFCEDEDCREWNNLWTEPDPENGGRRHVLPHVAECQMFDEKQGPTEQARPEEGEGQPVEKGGDERPKEERSSSIRQPKVTDSSADTLKHIARVREILQEIESNLFDREIDHDSSKLGPEEKPVFDEFTPKLAGSVFGSEEYKGFLAAMKPALDHHYAVNRHHPEFGERNILWVPVSEYEGYYEVSSFGDVRSVDRITERKGVTGDLSSPRRILKAHVTPKGYLRIQLVRNTKPRNYMVHRLVANAFLANPDEKQEVNHKNGDKADNRVENLEWVSPSENQKHAYDTGLKEPTVKYVVHCPKLEITTFGTQPMEAALKARGYDKASAAGIWRAIHSGGEYLDLTFEGTLLSEYQRGMVDGMTLIDLIEMLADWKAASERHATGNIRRSVDVNAERFKIGDQLKSILLNTIKEMGW